MRPGVAVVIPAFNHAHYLPEAVDSVLDQNYCRVDLLVIDDGSTDHTRTVLEGYGGRLHWLSRENLGQSATLNEGWSKTDGEILLYLGDDDRLLPGAIATAVSALEAHAEAVGVFGDYLLIDDHSRTLRRVTMPDVDLGGMLRDYLIPQAGAFVRRSVWRQVGGWDESLRQVPDRDFFLRVLLQGPMLRIREPLAAFRVHPASQTFRPRVAGGAVEPILVADRFFAQDGLPAHLLALKARARAMARVVAARHDLRRREWRAAVSHLTDAMRVQPAIALSPRAWRFVVNGLGGRPFRRPPAPAGMA